MKTYSKIRTDVRMVHQIRNGAHFKNTPNEIDLLLELRKKSKSGIPKNYISQPWFVHYTALFDIMESTDHYVVSKKFKTLLEEFHIPNIEFYNVPLYVGRVNNYIDYIDFKLTEDDYYYMHINPIEVSDIEIDYEKSEFFYHNWDDSTGSSPGRPIYFNSYEDFATFRLDLQIQRLWSYNILIKNANLISDIIYFGYNKIVFSDIYDPSVFSEPILIEFKKRKLKGVFELKPIIFNNYV